jgi:predicted TIM-barrel fold metal-dependent hydrolase
MLIVDAQVHIWSQSAVWGAPADLKLSCEGLLKEMEEGGVDAAVLHPPGWDANDIEVAAEAARQYPNRVTILARSRVRHGPRDVQLDWREIVTLRNRLRQKKGKTPC